MSMIVHLWKQSYHQVVKGQGPRVAECTAFGYRRIGLVDSTGVRYLHDREVKFDLAVDWVLDLTLARLDDSV